MVQVEPEIRVCAPLALENLGSEICPRVCVEYCYLDYSMLYAIAPRFVVYIACAQGVGGGTGAPRYVPKWDVLILNWGILNWGLGATWYGQQWMPCLVNQASSLKAS